MAVHFDRGTAHVDWCEPNYAISSNIAEFFNTISNIVYFVIPPLNIYLFWEYSRKVGCSFNIVWILMMVIGASSAYFHATLSLVGQLLDEVAILWVLFAGYALWTPEWMIQYTGIFKSRLVKTVHGLKANNYRKNYPVPVDLCQQIGNGFKIAAVVIAMVATLLGFIYPSANAVALMMLGAPCVSILWKEIQRCKSTKVVKLAYIGILWWFLAVTLWLSDRLLCDIWKYLSVPYFHCGWHIFILLGSNIACVLGCYFYAHSEHRELKSELSFWPAQLGTWGLPYIAVRKKHLQKRT